MKFFQDGFDDHAEWGVCQVGTSASFVNSEDKMSDGETDLALFGAPGDKPKVCKYIIWGRLKVKHLSG